MKLLDRYSRLNIAATIATFVVGSCAFYFLIHYILIRQLDAALQTEQQEITVYVHTHNALPEIIRTKDQYTSYEAVTDSAPVVYRYVKDTSTEHEELKEIAFTQKVGDKYYLVKVDKPLEGTRALLQLIIAVTVMMIAIILLTGLLINRVVIKRLWKPFYQTIDKVKNYHLSDQDVMVLPAVDIDEFTLLNDSVNEMIARIQRDFESLKNFTGQASHEMQTPLAIIRTRIDALVQNEAVLEHSARQINDIEKAVQRLSRLHQSLLLLTKVENKQFLLNEDVVLATIIADKCTEYTDMIQARGIKLSMTLQPTAIKFHHHLAEIMISNMLGNAIRYNKPSGDITITLENNMLSLSNTSANGELDKERLFKRFYRDNQSGEGTGLGLSIVKEIIATGGYSISYQYREAGAHIFSIDFNR